jgi:hypothetical protein
MADEDNRLHRIEIKLDKLAEAIVQLARMEERLVTLFNRMDSWETRQIRVESRVDELKAEVRTNKSVVMFGERLFWVILTGLVGTLFWIFRT